MGLSPKNWVPSFGPSDTTNLTARQLPKLIYGRMMALAESSPSFGGLVLRVPGPVFLRHKGLDTKKPARALRPAGFFGF